MTWPEGTQRLPYFYSHGPTDGKRSVLCPACIEFSVSDLFKFSFSDLGAPIQAHYFINRALLCSNCGVLIGPINDEEMGEL